MAFQTGYAANEFELQQKLDAFILSISGWTKISQIDTFDSVYFSSGQDGLKDIYIRTRAGVVGDTPMYAGTQRDFGDGYSGYLNFFAYQYFPEGGDGYDGYGEAGKYGPALHWCVGRDYNVLYLNTIGIDDQWTYTNAISNLNPPGEPADYSGYAAQLMDYCGGDFDGNRYWYYHTASNGFFRFDVAREAAEVLIQAWEGNRVFGGIRCWVDPRNRKEYVWYMKESSGSANNLLDGSRSPQIPANQLQRWNVDAAVAEFGFSGPVWTTGANGSYGDLTSDGHDNLYCFYGSSSKEWAKYHIPTDTWVNLVDLPVNFGQLDSAEFLDKKISGFAHHRLYWANQTGGVIYYVNLDENSGMPVGSWQSAGSTPVYANIACSVFHNFNNMFYFYPGQGSNGRCLYRAPMEDGTLTWTLHKGSTTYLPTDGQTFNSTFAYLDEYKSRVRTSLRDVTQYWFMGNKERIMVLTKSDGKYSFCYVGSVKQHTLTTPFAITTSGISAGTDVVVPINIIRGEFSVGQQLFISDVTDEGGIEYTSTLENITRKYKATEVFTISDVDPGVSITISSINNNYPAGSKIAYDPQPVGVTLDGLDRIQMLNCINNVADTGSIDMAENMARLQTVEEDIVNASGGDERRGGYALWPVNAVNGGSDAGSSGTELRGSLIGVFAVSNTGDLSSEDTVTVGTNTYMVFDVPSGAGFAYAFGPINE